MRKSVSAKDWSEQSRAGTILLLIELSRAAIGRFLPQIQRYEDGADIPHAVELAMAAVEAEMYAPIMMQEVWERVRGEE